MAEWGAGADGVGEAEWLTNVINGMVLVLGVRGRFSLGFHGIMLPVVGHGRYHLARECPERSAKSWFDEACMRGLLNPGPSRPIGQHGAGWQHHVCAPRSKEGLQS